MGKLFWPAFAAAVLVCAVSTGRTDGGEARELRRQEAQVAAYQAWDRRNAVPAGAVLFVGGVDVMQWNTAESFPSAPVVNRGLDHAGPGDHVRLADRLILPYRPAVIIVFADPNDTGRPPEATAADNARLLVGVIRQRLGAVPVIWLSSRAAPSGGVASTAVREITSKDQKVALIDTDAVLCDPAGRPKAALHDGPRLNPKGYQALTLAVAPILAGLVQAAPAAAAPQVAPPSPQGRAPAAPAPEASGYVASKTSKVFHKPSCTHAARISPKGLITFSTRDQAIQSGRRPCKTCNP